MDVKEEYLYTIKDEDVKDYLVNPKKQTGIKIPSVILNLIKNKLRDHNQQSIALADIIAMAILYLKSTNNTEGFRKTLDAISRSKVFGNLLTKNEAYLLYEFFSRIPAGYEFTNNNRIHSHTEISLSKL